MIKRDNQTYYMESNQRMKKVHYLLTKEQNSFPVFQSLLLSVIILRPATVAIASHHLFQDISVCLSSVFSSFSDYIVAQIPSAQTEVQIATKPSRMHLCIFFFFIAASKDPYTSSRRFCFWNSLTPLPRNEVIFTLVFPVCFKKNMKNIFCVHSTHLHPQIYSVTGN